MAAACEYCTGSHWLNDLPDLGQCVCCTPENMTAQEEAADEVVLEARAALQSYLVGLGHSAEPLSLPDPDLWRLADLLIYDAEP